MVMTEQQPVAVRSEEGQRIIATDYMEAHVNCRCTLVPRAKSYADILGDDSIPDTRPPVRNGAEEFARLSPDIRRAILGPGKAALYESGVPLEAFVGRHVSSQWGASRVAKPLYRLREELEAIGWEPGDPWPGYTPPARPGPTDETVPVEVPLRQPGEFESWDDVRAWWAREFPDVQLGKHVTEDLGMDAVNGTMLGLHRMRQMYPEAWKGVRAVNFTSAGMDGNTYAHVAGATTVGNIRKGVGWSKMKPGDIAGLADDVWVSNGFSSSTSQMGSVIEFNAGKWYRVRTASVTRPLTAGESYDASMVIRSKGHLQRLAREFGYAPDALEEWSAYDWYAAVGQQLSQGRFHYNRWKTTPGSLDDYVAAYQLSDRDAGLLRKYIALVDDYKTEFTPSGTMQDFKEYAEARDLLKKGTITVEGEIPLWASIRSDIRAGYHPDIGVPLSGDLTRQQQLDLISSIAVHEFGHVFDIDYMRKATQIYLHNNLTSAGLADMRWSAVWTEQVEKAMTGGVVSEYAKKNHFEKFAEAFAAVHLQPKTAWKPYTRRIARLLEAVKKWQRYEKDAVSVAPYGNSPQTLLARWESVLARARLNKESGLDLFGVAKEDAAFAPKAIQIIKDNPKLGGFELSQLIDDARYGS